MTLWRDFTRDQPAIARQAFRASEIVDRFSRLDGPDGFQSIGMSEYAAQIAGDPLTVNAGVYGPGAWVLDSEEVVPALFVQQGMAERGGTALGRSELSAIIPPNLLSELSNVQAIPLTQPSRFRGAPMSPGGAITIGSRAATSGIWVRCKLGGTEGYLTAGHAAPQPGVIVRDSRGEAVGRVLRSVHRGLGSSIDATADVALIEATSIYLRPYRSHPVGKIQPRSHVELRVSRHANPSWIRGLSPSFAVSPDEPPWGEVGLTAEAISMPGDSGASVISEDHVVASLVGGGRNEYSVVQDIEYQLLALDAEAL